MQKAAPAKSETDVRRGHRYVTWITGHVPVGYGLPPQGITGTVDRLFAGAPSINFRLIAR